MRIYAIIMHPVTMEDWNPRVFRALADPTRAQLFGLLLTCGGTARVGELAHQMAIDASGVSRHLAELERAGVIHSTRRGRERICSVCIDTMIDVFSNLVRQLERVKQGLPCC